MLFQNWNMKSEYWPQIKDVQLSSIFRNKLVRSLCVFLVNCGHVALKGLGFESSSTGAAHVPIWVLFLKHIYSSAVVNDLFSIQSCSRTIVCFIFSLFSTNRPPLNPSVTAVQFTYHTFAPRCPFTLVWLFPAEISVVQYDWVVWVLKSLCNFCTKWCTWHTSLYFCE